MEYQEEQFVFYGSWMKLFNAFQTEEEKKEFAWNLILAGTGNELETDSIIMQSIIKGSVIPNLKAAKGKYKAAVENGSKGGRPRKEIDIEKALELKAQGRTQKEIADEMGVSKGTIADRLREYEAQKPKTENRNQNKNQYIEIYTDTEKEREEEREKEIDYSGLSEKVGCDGSFTCNGVNDWIDRIYINFWNESKERQIEIWQEVGFSYEEAKYIIENVLDT